MSPARVALLLLAVAWLAAAGKPAPSEVQVGMKGLQFAPQSVQVKSGGVVVFQNDDIFPHDIYSTATPPLFDSGNLNPGATFRFTVPGPGTYPFGCRYHMTMQGSIVAR